MRNRAGSMFSDGIDSGRVVYMSTFLHVAGVRVQFDAVVEVNKGYGGYAAREAHAL